MKKKVLIVDYDTSSIDLIKNSLTSDSYEIFVTDDGDSAKNLLSNDTFNLVITAAMLPKLHGFSLSQYIAANHPDTKVIIISGIYKGVEYKHQAITQYKADDFFEKPLNKKEFTERVEELLPPGIESTPSSVSGKPDPSATVRMDSIENIEKEQDTLTSEDLFGDIIQKIEEPAKKKIPVSKPEFNRNVNTISSKEKLNKANQKFKRMDDEIEKKFEETLAGLGIKRKTPSSTPVKPRQKQKVSDDISRKLEDTLSGLGFSPDSKKSSISRPKVVKPAAAPPTPEPQKERQKNEFGDYDILGLIARGGMAEIYKAKKKGVKGFEKIIAIKKILSGYGKDDKYIEMFVDEAKIAAELTHPNIVQLYDLGRKDDYYFIAMEYVMGKDLRLIMRDLQDKEQKLPEELGISIILKILEGLGYAHSAKDSNGKSLDIVHRDVSPPNILIGYNGSVKLTDFGVSKASNKIHQTISGALKGKLLYMSPEQARGDADIDFRADLYSVGIILFEVITGQKLFLENSEMAVLKRVQNGNIIKPSAINKNISPELEKIILKALKFKRDERYQSAAEMILDLERYLTHHYSNQPLPVHIANFLIRLCNAEIVKNNIKVAVKPEPYAIKPIVRKKEPLVEQTPLSEPKPEPEPEIKKPAPKPEPLKTVKKEKPTAPVNVKDYRSQNNDFQQPAIEIDLDPAPKQQAEPVKIKEEIKVTTPEPKPEPAKFSKDPVKPAKKEEGKSPSLSDDKINDELLKLESSNSGAKKFIIAASVLLVLAAMYYAFTNFGGSSSSEPDKALIKTITAKNLFADTARSKSPSPVYINKDLNIKNRFRARKGRSLKLSFDKPHHLSEGDKGIIIKKDNSTQKPVILGEVEIESAETNKISVVFTKLQNNRKVINLPKSTFIQFPLYPETSREKSIKKDEPANSRPAAEPVKKEDTRPVEKPAEKKKEEPKTDEVRKDSQVEKKKEKPAKQPEKKEEPKTDDNSNSADSGENTKAEEKEAVQPEVKETVKEATPPPPPKAKRGDLVSSYDTAPSAINTPFPKISRKARKKLSSSITAIISVLIDESGNVSRIKFISKNVPSEVKMEVINQLYNWKYKPAVKDNVEVKTWKSITIQIKK